MGAHDLEGHALLTGGTSSEVDPSRRPDERTPILDSLHGTDASYSSKSSLKKTFGNIVISIVGAGILGLPYTFKQSGWLFSSIAVVAVAAVSFHCMLLLVRTRQCLAQQGHGPIATYGDLGHHVYGPWGSFAVDVMVLLSQGCFCVGYLIFIGENLQSLFGTSKVAIVFGLMPVQILLSWVRSLTGLAPFSIFADVTEVLAMAAVLQADIQHFQGFGAPGVRAVGSWSSMPFAVGVAIYAYEGFPLTLPLEASMKNRSKFPFVLALAMGCITLLYVTFGLMGYLAFADETKDIVTLNLAPGSWVTMAVKLGLSVGLFFTFPVMMHPCHEVMELRLLRMHCFQATVLPSPRLRNIMLKGMRALLVAVACVAAVTIPGFSFFMSVVGSTVCSILAFVLPAAFHLHVAAHNMHWVEQYVVNPQLIVFGSLFTVWGTLSVLSGAK